MSEKRDNIIELSEAEIEQILKQEMERRGYVVKDVGVFQGCSDFGKLEIYAEIQVGDHEKHIGRLKKEDNRMNIKSVVLEEKDVLAVHGYFEDEEKRLLTEAFRLAGVENPVMFLPPELDLTVLKRKEAEDGKIYKYSLCVKDLNDMEIHQMTKELTIRQRTKELEASFEQIIRLADTPEQAAKGIAQIFIETAEKVSPKLADKQRAKALEIDQIQKKLETGFELMIRLADTPEQAAKGIVQMFIELAEKAVHEIIANKK